MPYRAGAGFPEMISFSCSDMPGVRDTHTLRWTTSKRAAHWVDGWRMFVTLIVQVDLPRTGLCALNQSLTGNGPKARAVVPLDQLAD